MTEEQLNQFKATAQNLSTSLQGILDAAHNAIKEVAETDPETADELLKDLAAARQAKDMNSVNIILNKYANSSKQ